MTIEDNMSRRRIQCHTNRKKKPKGEGIPMRQVTGIQLGLKRALRKEEENAEIITLITEGKLDLNQTSNYQHMQSAAKELNWSVGRLQKATERVSKLLENEKKEKEDE